MIMMLQMMMDGDDDDDGVGDDDYDDDSIRMRMSRMIRRMLRSMMRTSDHEDGADEEDENYENDDDDYDDSGAAFSFLCRYSKHEPLLAYRSLSLSIFCLADLSLEGYASSTTMIPALHGGGDGKTVRHKPSMQTLPATRGGNRTVCHTLGARQENLWGR